MAEVYLTKDITSKPQEDGDSLVLGKIREEDTQNRDLASQQPEQKCDDLSKQNLLKEVESNTGLYDELLDLVDIVKNESDKFSKKLGVCEIFWKKVLKLLSFFNEALDLGLDLKLRDELALTKEKQKKKNLLFSFLDAIRKKLFKKELTLKEMLELQIMELNEQRASENDPELIHQIDEQLKFLMKLKDKLFELSLKESLNRTTEWLSTTGAMQTVAEMARGEYIAKEIRTTKEQWQKVDNLLGSGKFVRQIGNVVQNNRSLENKPFTPTKDQNNNLNLIPLPQNIAKDNSGFLKLLYTLLILTNVYVAKHMELGMGGNKEVHKTKPTQPAISKTNDQAQKQISMSRERKSLSSDNNIQYVDVDLQTLEQEWKPNSLIKEVYVRQLSEVNQNKTCRK